MRKKTAAFFRPNAVTIIIFLALALIMPVVYVYAEPERTNYLPDEQQHWDIKAKQYNGLLDELFFHTEGSLDDLAGILHRDYVSNYIGVPVLVIYYLVASGIKTIFHKKRPANITT
jgi:hypothetical protein